MNLMKDRLLLLIFAAVVLAAPLLFAPTGAAYPDLLQRFAIYGILPSALTSCLASPAILALATPPFSVSALTPPSGCSSS